MHEPAERERTRSSARDPADAPRTTVSRPSTSLLLFLRARQGQSSAVGALFQRLLPGLTRWSRGRLPPWARARMDTDDLVQEAVGAVFRRMDNFEPRRKRAIRAYLQQSIRNRIRDEVRRAGKVEVPVPTGNHGTWIAPGSSPLQRAISAENMNRYRDALQNLAPEDQELIIGRVELDYSYDQLALATSRPSRDAARVAVRRALLRLAREMDSG